MLKRFNKAKVRCPVVVYKEVNVVFLERKGRKIDKKPRNFPIFRVFMHFLSEFRQTSWIRMSKTAIKVRICRPVVFYEEMVVVSFLKNI